MARYGRIAVALAGTATVWSGGVAAQSAGHRTGDPAHYSLPVIRSGPPSALVARLDRAGWQPVRDAFAAARSEDRNQFAAVRALPAIRGQGRRRAIDASVELRMTGDLGGIATELGIGGLPRMVQRALSR